MLVSEGHSVDLACNDKGWPIDAFYETLGCQYYHVDLSRSPLSWDNVKAYGQLKKVIKDGGYDIVHCHTPNASVITRLVCRKYRKKAGLKVFYTAHGFHFYKGAPKLNWTVYYPVEKFCSRYTDKLITINKEDYNLAKEKFRAGEVCYIPGVGIDLSRFENVQVDRNAKRREIGVPEDAFLLLSVGELSTRKNHRLVIRALSEIPNTNIHYAIVGKGDLFEELNSTVKELNLSDRVHFLGYRSDIAEIYKATDVCCFPSIQEGLPVALMEAMACALPVVCSNIRGNVDLIDQNRGILFDPYSVDQCSSALITILNCDTNQMGARNKERVKNYSIENIIEKMKKLYER
jgi:glycosyltransferase involved in cell wall biosynthesis